MVVEGAIATGAYLEVRVRRFRGNERFPTYTPELEWLMNHGELSGAALNSLYGGWGDSQYIGWEAGGWDRTALTHNVVTNAGRDYIHNQAYITGAVTTNVFQWAGVTADSTAPATTDTTLASEITTTDIKRSSSATGNSHSVNTNTTTIGITWTSANTYTNLQKAALFTASTAGTMNHEALFSATSLNSGDQLALTWTITLG